MPLSTSTFASSVSFFLSSLPNTKVENKLAFSLTNYKHLKIEKIRTTHSFSRNGSSSIEFDVPFPRDYEELLDQAKTATQLALEDGKQLMEIEFPTVGLESVPGGIEMTRSMQLIREFCDRFVSPEQATKTRVFFPEANEVKFARESAFGGCSLKLDYLTKPSVFEDFGFVEKVRMRDRVKAEDELFLVAYPYFNVNEMLVVEDLYKEAVADALLHHILCMHEKMQECIWADGLDQGCVDRIWFKVMKDSFDCHPNMRNWLVDASIKENGIYKKIIIQFLYLVTKRGLLRSNIKSEMVLRSGRCVHRP